MTVKTCIKNLQLILRILLAGIFIIHPGIIAPVVTVYNKMIHAHRLPDISSKILSLPSLDYLLANIFTLFSFGNERTQSHQC